MSDSYYELLDTDGEFGEKFAATDFVRSTWSAAIQHAAPVSALLVRGLEHCERRDDTRLSRVLVDLLGPVPAEGDHAVVGAVDDALLDGLVELAGTPGETALLMAELRQLGGAFGRAPEGAGARDRFEGDGLLFAVGMAMDEQMAGALRQDLAAFREMTFDLRTDHYLNFAEQPEDRVHRPEVWERLAQIKADVDPDDVIRSNHPIR